MLASHLFAALMASWLCFSLGTAGQSEVQTEYYPSGRPREEISYRNGLRHGVTREYYENGVLKAKIPFRKDKRNGTGTWFYESGTLMSKSRWKKGVLNGFCRSYGQDGKLYRESFWNRGRQHGVERTFYQSGNRRSVKYAEGQRQGPARWFYPSGKVFAEVMYVNDRVVSGPKFFRETGDELEAPEIPAPAQSALNAAFGWWRLMPVPKEILLAYLDVRGEKVQNAITGDFDKDGELDWAFQIDCGEGDSRRSTVAVLFKRGDQYVPYDLKTYGDFIRLQAEGSTPYDFEARCEFRCTRDGISVEWFERASMLYLYRNAGFEEICTGD